MAVNKQTAHHSKRLLFNLITVSLLSCLILLSWTISLWLRFGFDNAWQRLYEYSMQQQASIIKFNDVSVVTRLNILWRALPNVSLSKKLSEINHAIQHALPHSDSLSDNELKQQSFEALKIAKNFWQLVVLTIQVMLIKITILLTALPLFILAMTAGLVDGLNQRAIRTASLGRESSYMFHQLNRLFKQGLIALFALWLAIPVSITPALIFVPLSVLLSVMVSITACRFKKYL